MNEQQVGKELHAELLERIEALTALVKQQNRRPMPTPEWLDIKRAAVYLSLSGKTIRRAITSGMLPCSSVGTPDRATYRISRKDLDEYMERRKAGAIPRPRKKKNAPEPVKTLPPNRYYPGRTSSATAA
jgi:excisionase family DNA binding protein